MPDNKATPHSEIKKAIEPAKAPEPKTAPATEVKKTAEPDKVPEPTAVPAAEVKKPAETAKAPEPKMAPTAEVKKPAGPAKAPDPKAVPAAEVKKPAEPAKAPESKTAPAAEVKKPTETAKAPDPKAVPAAEVKKPAEAAKAPESKAAPAAEVKKPAEPAKAPEPKASPAKEPPKGVKITQVFSDRLDKPDEKALETLPVPKEGEGYSMRLHPDYFFDFLDHPFTVNREVDDYKELFDSIKLNGINEPVKARPRAGGGLELLSGHRRHDIAKQLNYPVPVVIVQMDDDSARIEVVDGNLHRQDIPTSELARAAKMKMEALARKAGRRSKLEQLTGPSKRTDQIVAEDMGMSRNQVNRLVRIDSLVPELKRQVDDNSNASEVIAELPTTTTGTTTSGGSVSVTLEWNFSGTSYNSAPGATNSFTWTATAPENYEFASGVDTTGEITVTNKSADSPTITGTNQAVTYDGNAIDVSTMFSGIPAGSNPTYSIVEGSDTTGEGTLSDTGDLTVTKAGDFKIKVTTQASGNYTAGEATATLTVNKGSFTATVYMRNYAQGGTPSTPSVSGNKSYGKETYYYNTTDTTGGGTEWTTDRGKTLAAGTYYMYAVIAETDLYNSCTTSATSFRVIDAAAGIVEPTARDLTYTGKSQELIEPGSIAGGTMVYSLSENGEYSETIPTRINAGTYYVWYKAEGDTQAIDKVSVTIQKAFIVSLNIPETYQLTKPYSSGDDVLDLLQSLYDPAVGTTKDGGEIPVNVPWWGRDIVFDSRPGKTNNFTWSIIITGSYVPQNYTFQADMIGSDGNVSGEIVVYNIPEEGAYTVTLNNVGTGSYGAGSYAAGTEVTIHAGDREGYVFIGWSTEDMVLNDPCSPVTTFTMPDCDVVVEALWYKEEPSHSVTLPTWDVIVEDCSHGTVEPWPEEAKMTTTITVTVTPDKGYELGSLIVTDESGNELELTDKGDGVFTFRMPNSDVTIEVTFQPVSDSSTSGDLTITAPAGWVNPYTDVAANAWYYNAVGYASANGLMSGTSATTFSPNTAMTRAMIVTVLARFAGVDTTTGDTWYDAGQQWAVANGISDGTALDRDITRQELVTMLWRYAGSPAMNVPELALIGSYPDSADVSAWAQNAFAWAISKGIIEGRDGLLAPADGATRAEAATILARFHLLTK